MTTRYRVVAARTNYLALDRPDIQYTVKELRRGHVEAQEEGLGGTGEVGTVLAWKAETGPNV